MKEQVLKLTGSEQILTKVLMISCLEEEQVGVGDHSHQHNQQHNQQRNQQRSQPKFDHLLKRKKSLWQGLKLLLLKLINLVIKLKEEQDRVETPILEDLRVTTQSTKIILDRKGKDTIDLPILENWKRLQKISIINLLINLIIHTMILFDPQRQTEAKFSYYKD